MAKAKKHTSRYFSHPITRKDYPVLGFAAMLFVFAIYLMFTFMNASGM